MRTDQRRPDELRPVRIDRTFQPHAFAPVLMAMGGTQVICAVTLEKGVPKFLTGTGRGWITAAEKRPFSQEEFSRVAALARQGLTELLRLREAP